MHVLCVVGLFWWKELSHALMSIICTSFNAYIRLLLVIGRKDGWWDKGLFCSYFCVECMSLELAYHNFVFSIIFGISCENTHVQNSFIKPTWYDDSFSFNEDIESFKVWGGYVFHSYTHHTKHLKVHDFHSIIFDKSSHYTFHHFSHHPSMYIYIFMHKVKTSNSKTEHSF